MTAALDALYLAKAYFNLGVPPVRQLDGDCSSWASPFAATGIVSTATFPVAAGQTASG